MPTDETRGIFARLFRRTEASSALSDGVKRPWMLFWVMLLPQLLLLFLNVRAWKLAQGEMSSAQLLLAHQVFFYEVVLLVAAAVAWTTLRQIKRLVGLAFCGFALLAGIGYLWFFTAISQRLVPNTVPDWMLPGSQLIYYQYALMMPALFYAGLRLACFPLRLRRGADVGLSVLAVILVPGTWYVSLMVFSSLFHHHDPSMYVILVLAVGSTLILMMAFLRLLAHLYDWLSGTSWGRPVMLFVAALLAPIGGLLLNRRIPFPYDFQAQSVYVLTCLNALFLLLPSSDKTGRDTLLWCLRAATYPFTLYFFIVFLPFMPLALPAMIAAGAGFLILAPTLLFIVHTRTLVDEGRTLAAALGGQRVLMLFAVCVSFIPLAYTGRAVLDKHALTQALDAAYRPDYDVGSTPVNRHALERTLRRLHDVKNGRYLPFITDWYDQVVLDGMVLPDRKAAYIERMFFGTPLEYRRTDSTFRNFFSPAVARRRARNVNRFITPGRNVALVGCETKIETTADATTTTLVLSLQNRGAAGSEYVTDITLPAGVLVSGYWLHIGEERVPGRIFEKKAAMWVYHMIRDTVRLDPGMLVYAEGNRLKLSVFPFAAEEWRTTEIAFTFPTGMAPHVRIGERDVVLAEAEPRAGVVFQYDTAPNTTLIIPTATAAALPPVTRPQYLHFIVDCSGTAEGEYDRFTQIVARLTNSLPDSTMCRVTLANYEFRHVTDGLISIGKAAEVIPASRGTLPFRGALCPERAIKSALLTVRDMPPLAPSNLPMVPVFVVLRAEKSYILREEDFGPFADIVPDVSAYYVARSGGRFDEYAFAGEAVRTVAALPNPEPVIILRAGASHAVCRTDRSSVVPLDADKVVERYDPESASYVPLAEIVALLPESVSGQGLALMGQWKQTVYRPALEDASLAGLVRQSRETGILIPSTSYIVVENSAQWQMLERAENKSLKADQNLEFDEFVESPAPPILFLLPVVFLLPYWRRHAG